MKTFHKILLIFSVLLLGACGVNPAATPGLSATSAPFTSAPDSTHLGAATAALPGAATPVPARPSAGATATAPGVAPKSTPQPSGSAPAYIQRTLGDQVIQINAQELMTVATASFTLSGQAPAGSVVSVNNDFIVVGSNRVFTFPITLEEGPNLVEVVASNAQGQQVSAEIVVVYDPTP